MKKMAAQVNFYLFLNFFNPVWLAILCLKISTYVEVHTYMLTYLLTYIFNTYTCAGNFFFILVVVKLV